MSLKWNRRARAEFSGSSFTLGTPVVFPDSLR